MSNVSRGNTAEARAKAILQGCGYTLAAEAKRSPIWRAGTIIGNSGKIDLVKSSVDSIFIKKGSRTLFVQVCHTDGESPRRQKLRSVDWDPVHHEVHLWAWDASLRAFRVYRDVDDYLLPSGREVWLMRVGMKCMPWEEETMQVRL